MVAMQQGSVELGVVPVLRQVGSALFMTRVDLTLTAAFRFLPRIPERALRGWPRGWSLTSPGWLQGRGCAPGSSGHFFTDCLLVLLSFPLGGFVVEDL